MMSRYWGCFLAAIVVSGMSLTQADEITMHNGSRLIGTLLSSEGGKIRFKTDFAGAIEIDMASVDTVRSDRPVTLVMADGRVYEDRKITARNNAMVIVNAAGVAVSFDIDEVDKINPEPWQLAKGYKFFGSLGAALSLESGNTDSEELDFDYEAVWRSLRNRYSSKGRYALGKSNGVKHQDKWRMVNKYDRFREGTADNYYGALLTLEANEFSNIDLRTYIGPYIGRQFFAGKLLALTGEIGLVYVNEQFIAAEADHDYFGGSWVLHFTSDYLSGLLGGNTRFYIDHDGIASSDDISAPLLNTTVGISVPVYNNLEVAAQFRLEYDGGVAQGLAELDKSFRLRLGYTW